jgi:hypothetical protein
MPGWAVPCRIENDDAEDSNYSRSEPRTRQVDGSRPRKEKTPEICGVASVKRQTPPSPATMQILAQRF